MSTELDALLDAAGRRVGMLLKGKWTIDRVLGVGGMASVYLATHRNGSKVAVKILHAHLAVHPDTLRRFLREGYLSNKVEHPDVVHVLDDDVAPDGAPFLVMELLDGRSLDAVLEERGPFVVKDAVDVVARVLVVLEAAHAKGIVHRDLKPANVFLLRNGAIKVLDFGIARLHEVTASHAATMGGTVLGTPAFMPPEQARGRWDDVDPRSDLWAMGATLFMLLTNRSVRDEATTANEALLYAMSKPVAPMSELVPTLARPIASVIDRALAFDKLARWPTTAAMRDALSSALEAAGRGVGDTIIDLSSGDPLQTGAAAPYAHVATPGGLGPGGVLAGTTPSSMPPPTGTLPVNGAPLPLFTAPRMRVAPAATPQFDLRSLTPTGTSQRAQAPSTTGAALVPPALSTGAIAGLIALGMVIAVVVTVAVLLARPDRPSAPSTANAGVPSATATASSTSPIGSIVIGDPSSTAPSATVAATASAPTAATTKPRKPAASATGPARSPLDQGRF